VVFARSFDRLDEPQCSMGCASTDYAEGGENHDPEEGEGHESRGGEERDKGGCFGAVSAHT
jgi:hypothetical protein